MAQRTIEATLALADAEIPAKGYLIISKVATPQTRPTTDNGFPTLYSNANAIHGIWAGMPDLEALFGEEGRTILLKTSQINVDADSTTDPKATLRNFPDYRFDHDGDDQHSAGTPGAHANTGDDQGDGMKDNENNLDLCPKICYTKTVNKSTIGGPYETAFNNTVTDTRAARCPTGST